MIIDNLLEINDRDEFRSWLEDNSTSQDYCWVIVSIKPKPDTLQYLDAVEECICFGWIDGIKKKTNDGQLAQRFSPRKKKSNWTELNKERARRLIKLGKMTIHGERILPDLSESSFQIDDEVLNRIKEDDSVYESFMKFPELYRRIRIDTIQSVKKDRELFLKRLDKLVEQTKLGRMYGQWNDGGRLIEQ